MGLRKKVHPTRCGQTSGRSERVTAAKARGGWRKPNAWREYLEGDEGQESIGLCVR